MYLFFKLFCRKSNSPFPILFCHKFSPQEKQNKILKNQKAVAVSKDVGRQVNLLFIQVLILFLLLLLLLLFFCPKDIDPCTNVTCDYHAICKAFSAFDARCVCDDNCPSYEEPVCSSNSTTFKNKCFCLLDICKRKSNHTLYHPGSCTGKIADYKYFLNHLNQRTQSSSVMRYGAADDL